MSKPQYHYDLARFIFGTLFIVSMIVTCLWIMTPFILGFTWASMVVIATWPILIKLQKILWNKRWLAVLIMALLLTLFFIIPISFITGSVINSSTPILEWAREAKNWQIPPLLWLEKIPLVGDKLYHSWHSITADGGNAIIAKIQPYIGQAITWFITQIAHIGLFMLHCALMLIFSILLYSRGEDVARGIRHFAFRLGAERADAAVILAAQSIQAVALGVVITALIQSLLGGIGLAISGIPYSTLLTILMFICCLAQLGPGLVLLPAIIWLYWQGETSWGSTLLVWSLIVGTLDNVLRPILIRLGAQLPMLLILIGVIGGLLALGMIGLFIGPAVLAVSYRLITAWMNEVPVPTQESHLVLRQLKQP